MSYNPTWATSTQGLNNSQFSIIDNTNTYMYVANGTNNTITQILLSNPNTFNSSWATSTQKLNGPVGLSIDNTNTYMYVTNQLSNTITQILLSNPNTFNANWATSTQGLDSPIGVTIDKTNTYMYVANYNTSKISQILLSNPNTFNANWATSTQGLDIPYGLVIDITNTYMYVANRSNNTITQILLSNPNTFNANWATSNQLLNRPSGVTIDKLNTYMYVANNNSNSTITQILLSNPNTFNASWATSTQGLDGPIGVTIDNTNTYIYVANYNNSTISQIQINYPRYPCFKEDTKILTDKGYLPIQNLKNGDLVKTLLHDYKPIVMIGKREIQHPASKERIKDQLYKCSENEYPEVFEPLVITGCHSILVDDFISEKQKERVIEVNGNTYVTDNKYRLPACADLRASVYEIPGNYTIYHLALANDDYYMNYGIYANGLLVETCSKRYLKELSNMELIE